jgi:hypothetical protein
MSPVNVLSFWSPGLTIAAAGFAMASLPLLTRGRWALSWSLLLALTVILALAFTLWAHWALATTPIAWWRWFVSSVCLFAIPAASALAAAWLVAHRWGGIAPLAGSLAVALGIAYVPSVLAASRFVEIINAVQG